VNTPLVTVITVTYNSSKYINAAIDSILASTYTNFELIIGDDNSKDSTWQIVNTYTDSRIIKYKNETNIGEYPNRNKAIDLAKGEYLIFIDGDDMIYPQGLAYMTKMLHNFPDCAMALMYPFLDWVFYPIVISPKQFFISNFFGKGFNDIAFTNTFFRTKVVQQNKYLSTQFRCGDVYTRLKIANEYNTLVIQDQLTWWRETPNQASQMFAKSTNSIIESYELNIKVLLENNNLLTETELQNAIENQYFSIKNNLKARVKKLDIKGVFVVGQYLFKNKILYKILTSQKISINIFKDYDASNPYTNNQKIVEFH